MSDKSGASDSRAAEVYVHDTLVGRLEYFGEPHEIFRFDFDEDWNRQSLRPTLGLAFEDNQPKPIETYGLHPWFHGLLPQGPLRRFLSKVHGLVEGDDFELLLALGNDLPGAVRLVESAPRLSGERQAVTLQPASEGLELAFSLSGARWKLSVKDGERGLVIPVRGDTGDWIAKFDDPTYPGLPSVEHSTTRWARAAGLPTPDFKLVDRSAFHSLPDGIPVGDGSVYLSRRFDRAPLVHMEDFGQVLGRPEQNHGRYEDIAKVIAAVHPASLRPFVEQLVFCVLSGNGDAHLKNWTLVYPDKRRPALSLAYDLVCTLVYLPNDGLALKLDGNEEFAKITPFSFAGLARESGVDEREVLEWVDEAAKLTRSAWTAGAGFGFSEPHQRAIANHLARVPLGL